MFGLNRFYHFNFQNCVEWKFIGGTAVVVKTVSGLFPLSWQDGAGGNLVSLKVKGKTKKTIVIDGTRYVVPDDVELRTDITNGTSNTNVNTGLYANDNMEMFARFKAITGSFYIFQSRSGSTATIYGISGANSGSTISAYGVTSDITRTGGHIYTVKVTLVNRAVTLYVKDETTGDEDTKTGTAASGTYPFPSPTTIKLFGDASRVDSGVTVYEAYIKTNGNMSWYMCGAVKNDVVGVWNPVTGEFKTPTGTITAGPKTRTVRTAQMVSFDRPDAIKLNANFTNGAVAENTDRWAMFIPVVGGQTYSFRADEDGKTNGWYLCQIAADTVAIGTSYKIDGVSTFVNRKGYNDYTLTTDASAKWIGINVSMGKAAAETWFDGGITMVEGSTVPTQYIPYTIEVPLTELYGVGDRTANLFDKAAVKVGYYLNSSGAEVSNAAWNISDYMPVVGGEIYYQTINTPGQSPRTCWYDANKTFISASEQHKDTQTAPSNAKYCRMCVWRDDTDIAMFTHGSTAPASYIPYGYSVDVLMWCQGVAIFDGSADENWQYDSTYGRFSIQVNDAKVGATRTIQAYVPGWNCLWHNESISSVKNGDFYVGTTNFLFHSGEASVADWKAKLQVTPITLYYQRTTDASFIHPVTYTAILSDQLNGVGDNSDVYDFVSGSGAKAVAEYTFTGGETFTMHASLSGLFFFSLEALGGLVQPTSENYGLCSHYTAVQKTARSIAAGECCFQALNESSNARFCVRTTLDSINALKAEIKAQAANGTPWKIRFPLATSVPITGTPQEITIPEGACTFDCTNLVKTSGEISYPSRTVRLGNGEGVGV